MPQTAFCVALDAIANRIPFVVLPSNLLKLATLLAVTKTAFYLSHKSPQMLLTITCQGRDADKLGFLLHKHPARFQTISLSYGQCHVFYPKSSSESVTACLLLDIDPVAMTKNKRSKRNSFGSGRLRQRPPLRRIVLLKRRDRQRLWNGHVGHVQKASRSGLDRVPGPSVNRRFAKPRRPSNDPPNLRTTWLFNHGH